MEAAAGTLRLASGSDRAAFVNSADQDRQRELARAVLDRELAGLSGLRERVGGPDFLALLDLLISCRGRLVVTGVGKSGLIAERIAASMRSTGTKAVFLHPTDALHGDLGLLEPDDVGLFFSKSGESQELLALLPGFRRLGVPVAAITAEARSSLAREADRLLALGAIEEAGPLSVVPTTSGLLFHALGDVLVTCLYVARGFTETDLAFLHPGGLLGERITTRVWELMHHGTGLPIVPEAISLREALVEMIGKKLGLTTVVDEGGRLAGILTDGDIRRVVHEHGGVDHLSAGMVMTRNPKTIDGDALIATAVHRMETNPGGAITALVVVDSEGRPAGVLHLHDCLRRVGPNGTRPA